MITGNSSPYGFFVFGLIEEGPVVPIQPPKTFVHTTKKIFVSITFPGPTSIFHHPFFFVTGFFPVQN